MSYITATPLAFKYAPFSNKSTRVSLRRCDIAVSFMVNKTNKMTTLHIRHAPPPIYVYNNIRELRYITDGTINGALFTNGYTSPWVVRQFPYVHRSYSLIGIAIPGYGPGNSGIPDRFSIPKSRDCERPNPGISGLENNVLTLLLRLKCMH